MSRADHLAEMRFAVANHCSLAEAKQQMARLRWAAIANASNQAATVAFSSGGQSLCDQQPAGQSQFWWNND